MVVGGSAIFAAELKSGLRPGDYIGSFDAVKCAGAVNDGIEVGHELCYVCHLGLRPVVLVFAQNPEDPALAGLLTRIEKIVAKHEDKQLAGLVSLLGADREALIDQAKQLAGRHKLAHIALVVPVEHQGPADFDINPVAAVTVMIYNEAQVVGSYAFAPGGLKEEAIERMVADTEKMLGM
jgi:hypothetical protein